MNTMSLSEYVKSMRKEHGLTATHKCENRISIYSL